MRIIDADDLKRRMENPDIEICDGIQLAWWYEECVESAKTIEIFSSQETMPQYEKLVARLIELEELSVEIQKATGFTLDEILRMFLKGYTLQPNYTQDKLQELGSIACEKSNR